LKIPNKPIRQHWVPKMYLRNFANEASKLSSVYQTNVLDIKSKKEFISSIDNIFLKKNFYTFGIKNSEPNFIIEETLSKIESWAAPSLKAMVEGEPVHKNPNNKMFMGYFLATLVMRNPYFQQKMDQHLKTIVENPSIIELFQIDEEQMKIIDNWYSNLDDDGQHLIFLKNIMDCAKEITDILIKKSWGLFTTHDNYFITSDNPVVMYHPTEIDYGMSTLGVSIHIALSPHMLLVLSDETIYNEEVVYNVPFEIVDSLNHLTAHKANNFVISAQSFSKIKSNLFD